MQLQSENNEARQIEKSSAAHRVNGFFQDNISVKFQTLDGMGLRQF